MLELDAEQLLGLLDVPGDVLGPDYPDEVIDPVHITGGSSSTLYQRFDI